MKVVIVGSGNVAAVLGRKIRHAGHEIVQVVGRNVVEVDLLAHEFNCNYTYKLHEVNTIADLIIIAVSDRAIEKIAQQLRLDRQLVVHTAAGVPIDVLAATTENYGCIYPLQSLRKESLRLPSIPILIDGINDTIKARLAVFAADWADSVGFAGDEERVKLHLGAVFANNFTNHLFSLCRRYFVDNGLEFNRLLPLVEETMLRIKEYPASNWQTGPAVRRDYGTMKKHEQLLSNDPDALLVYKTLSNSIMNHDSGSNI